MEDKVCWFFSSYYDLFKFSLDVLVYIGFGFFSCQWVIQRQKINFLKEYMENGFKQKVKQETEKEVQGAVFREIMCSLLDHINDESNKKSPPSQ